MDGFHDLTRRSIDLRVGGDSSVEPLLAFWISVPKEEATAVQAGLSR